jgi:ABC-type glycerol-3-phosphate transport system substrate-binding protein
MKKFLLPALAIALFTFSACEEEHDDHAHSHATITFLHPTDNDSVALADANAVDIHVKFEWDGEEGEAVEVKLIAEGQTDSLVIDFDLHQHDALYEFEELVNLSSFPAGTAFHLEAKAFENHEGTEFVESSIHFTLVP